jgi:hypothetical protein
MMLMPFFVSCISRNLYPELLVWTEVRPTGPTPKARFAHSFTAVSAREAVLFGGAGAEADFADVFMLTDGDALSHGLAS